MGAVQTWAGVVRRSLCSAAVEAEGVGGGLGMSRGSGLVEGMWDSKSRRDPGTRGFEKGRRFADVWGG